MPYIRLVATRTGGHRVRVHRVRRSRRHRRALRSRPRVSWWWRRGLVKRSWTGHRQSPAACGSAFGSVVSCPTTVGVALTVLTGRNGAVFGGPVEGRR
jgi:hypothetical protein